MKNGEMPLFDWGSKEANQEHYGEDTPPKVDLSKIQMPTAMFVGTEDDLGDPVDARWGRDQLAPGVLKHYEEYPGGHLTFQVGKDFSYFNRVMNLLGEYNPVHEVYTTSEDNNNV
jgi:hypothetical protein